MDRRSRDSANYNLDYQKFIQNLQKFHGSRGSIFKRIPFFGGKELDLFLLYKTVTSLGGCSKVTDEKKWREVAKCFNLPASCTNAAFSLRQYYLRYLASYERIHFLGEDGDDNSLDLRRAASSSFLQPTVNFFQNNIQEPSRKIVAGPLGEPRVNNFDRLIFSLMSGLPNEVDFALNICTLLSNVTNSIFNLAKAPTIVELMLAHVGIFTEGKVSMRDLYKEWYQDSDRDFDKFWRESIDDETVKELYNCSCGCAESEPSSESLNLFSDGTSKLGESVEAKRANQICVILHNFSYEELNRLFISSHSTCIRFLLLCAGSKLMSLRKTALDALDNVTDKMTLGILQDKETQIRLRVLHSFIFSKDRTRKVRAISILAKLSGQQENEDVLSDALPQDIYEELIKCLTIPDIQLILNSLDALYFLSDLGEATATAIIMVNRSIDILVCLVTVHAESYGNRAIAGFRIVENKNSVHAQKHSGVPQNHQRNIAIQQMQRSYAQLHPIAQQMPIPQVRPSPKPQMPSNFPPVRPDTQKQEENEEVEPEIFSARWISAFYELAPGSEIKRSQIYADYIESCKELGRKGVLNAQSFFKILGLVIPAPYWRPSDSNDPTIAGIKRRASPLLVKNKSARPPIRIPDVTSTQSDQSVPVRPIPVMPSITSQSHFPPRMPFNAQPNPLTSLNNPGGFAGHMQGPRANPASTVTGQVPTSVMPMPLNGQGLPLKLLEEHVNSQGQSKSLQNNEKAKKSMDAGITKADTNAPPDQQPQPQVSKQASAQVSVVSQPVSGNVLQGQPIISNLAQIQQSSLLQGTVPGIAVSTPGANAVGNQNSLEPKLNSQQKLTSKERNERKKAMKAARDMINADIKASNLDPLTQCQNLTERIQKEMQQHFVQFHVHQQSIQAIQAQLQQLVLQNQQPKLPQNVMEDIHSRVRSHHAQMQAHYQKLQQLQILLQQVKIRVAQEQKLKEQGGSQDSTTETDSIAKTPKTPRILRKQPASSMAPNAGSSSGQVTIPQVQQLQPTSVVGFVPMQQINSTQVVAPSATQQTQQMTVLPSSQPSQMANVSTIVDGEGPSLRVAGGSSNSDVTPSQSSGIPAQVTFLSNAAAMQAQTSGVHAATITTPGKQAGAQVMQKPVAVTYNTPILPRPPSSTLQIQQNIPNSALVGQTVLFTMPVVALPQQGIPQATPNLKSRIPAQRISSSSTSSSLVDTTMCSNPADSSNVSPLQNNNVVISVVQEEPGRTLQAVGGANSKLQTKMNSELDMKGGDSVLGSAISQGIVTSPVKMSSVQSENSLFNGPIKTCSPITVNGGVQNKVGKGFGDCNKEQELALENVGMVKENGQVNGTSKSDAVSTVLSTKQCEKEKLLEEKGITVKRSGLVNGDCVGFAVNNSNEVNENMIEKKKKRKFDDSIEPELKNGDNKKKENNDNKIIEGGNENNDPLITRLDAVIKTNKKLKLNGIYVNNLKEKADDDKMETKEGEDQEESKDEGRERLQNGIENIAMTSSVTYTSNAEDYIKPNVDDFTENSQNTVEEDVIKSMVKSTVESNEKNLMEPKDQKAESSCEMHQKREKEKYEKKRFSCQWASCKGCFSSTSDLLAHMVLSHAPQEGSLKVCKVNGCKPIQRPRGSMICHFSQVHCNINTASDDDQVTLPQLLFPKVIDIEREDESPVTRSVRLTAALVLRNIARNSSYGRKVIMNYEARLAPAAMSSSEASSAVAACLEELTRKRKTSSDCMEGDNTS